MTDAIAALPATIGINGTELAVWPRGQVTSFFAGAQLAITTFADFADYHPALIEATLAAEQDPRFHDRNHKIIPAGCGNKVRNVQDWNIPAATLIHARALMMAHHSTSRQSVFPDDTWASVCRTGDYCMPHGHPRSEVSIVYMLDPGDSNPTDSVAGRLSFIDPRIDFCCPIERGRVTRPLMPPMPPGMMVIFSSNYLHCVNPYRGTRPRITLSWNITHERLPGRPREWVI